MLVVQCDDLQGLLGRWQGIVQKYAPQGYFDPIPPELFTALENSPRIQWFFYTDSSDGIAVRLYDGPFQKAHPYAFDDTYGDPWVILRGHNLGRPKEECKRRMRAETSPQHGNGPRRSWPAREAPGGPAQPPVGLVTAGEPGRLQYFENQYHNNAVAMPPPPDKEVTSGGAIDKELRALRKFREAVEEAVRLLPPEEESGPTPGNWELDPPDDNELD